MKTFYMGLALPTLMLSLWVNTASAQPPASYNKGYLGSRFGGAAAGGQTANGYAGGSQSMSSNGVYGRARGSAYNVDAVNGTYTRQVGKVWAGPNGAVATGRTTTCAAGNGCTTTGLYGKSRSYGKH